MLILSEAEMRAMDLSPALERWHASTRDWDAPMSYHRFLLYLGVKISNRLVLDYPTGRGDSSLCLGINGTNIVQSWAEDTKPRRKFGINYTGLNMNFFQGDILEAPRADIQDADIIVYAFRPKMEEGVHFETFLKKLKDFNGLLVLPSDLVDDTSRFLECSDLYRKIPKPKETLTFLTRARGACLVTYKEAVSIIYEDGKRVCLDPIKPIKKG